LITLFLVVAVLAVVFGVAAFLTGRAEGMSYEPQDLASVGIPRDRAMTADDVSGLRFALALRGYRMSEVDDALDRLAAEIGARDEAIAQLRARLSQGAAAPAPSGDETWAFGAPDTAADAAPDTAPDAASADPWSDFRAPAAEAEEEEADDSAEEEYVPSDATGDLPSDTPVDVPTTPEGWSALDPTVAVETSPDTPTFVEPPAPNPFRPEVPDIPVYDPWAVTPRSRYADGPEYVEVEHDDDEDVASAVTEHHTGYAPAPAEATTERPDDGDAGGVAGDDGDGVPERPPWQR
jgi:DivIVA domain-containing protein